MCSAFRFSCAISSVVIALAAEPFSTAPKLEGAPNFRDLGGYRTRGGLVVRPGLVYRSGQLGSLTKADYASLHPLHIRNIFDLRSRAEREHAPTRWIGEVPAFTSLDSLDPNVAARMMRSIADPAFTPVQARELMVEAMATLPLAAAPSIGTWIAGLADGQIPAIIHCSAGKDRTGVFVAVLLTLLDIDYETVLLDYLRSNEVIQVTMASTTKAMPPGMRMDDVQPNVLSVLSSVDAEYLAATFRSIDTKFGSFENYRRDGLHIDDTKLKRLRERLLTTDTAR